MKQSGGTTLEILSTKLFVMPHSDQNDGNGGRCLKCSSAVYGRRASCCGRPKLRGHHPWARTYDDGHGSHWKATGEYVARHVGIWHSS